MGNQLYDLQKGFKILQPKVISYLRKCFSYSISQNIGDSKKTAEAITNIIPHAFGEHNGCGNWCKFKLDPKRKHSSLPYGKCLAGLELREALKKVFSKHADNAARLCFKSSTNPNESFNNMVASKAPKYCHYSKSESLDFRIASTVCQKNVGETYVNIVNDEISLSPGKVCRQVSNRRDSIFLKRKERDTTLKAKRRRLQLKSLRNTTTTQKEVREGVTYQSSMCLNSPNDDQLVSIPPLQPRPKTTTKSNERLLTSIMCAFDLETTSLLDSCEIAQISVVTLDEQYVLDTYVLPNGDISSYSSKVTALTKRGSSLFHQGKLVSSVPIREGLVMFSEWLSSLNEEIVLLGHNIKAFDCKHFLRHTKECDLESSFQRIVGYIDTLPLFKSLYPENTTYSQQHLYRNIIGGEYDAHNSLADVKALAKILNLPNVTTDVLCSFSMTSSSVEEYCSFLSEKKSNVESFHILLQEKVLSKGMIDKAASNGLKYEHLHRIFIQDGEVGLRSLLAAECEGGVRVTKSGKILSSLVAYFNSL